MGDIASQSRWKIASSSQGNKRLRRVQSSQVSSDAKREAQTAQGEDEIVGTTFSPGAITISFTAYVEKGTPEVDYKTLFDSGEYFTLDREIVGGKSYQYVDCQVSTFPNVSGDNSGAHTFQVSILCRAELPL
jgi:hypothetical protein